MQHLRQLAVQTINHAMADYDAVLIQLRPAGLPVSLYKRYQKTGTVQQAADPVLLAQPFDQPASHLQIFAFCLQNLRA
ncbi:hypothetical protein SRABI106_04111 [Rahnella aquatilis]|nr:hypothetical protein SRABI106_04111 [Rahnella aquatilis]